MSLCLQITSGTGPVEVRRFVSELADALAVELARRGMPPDTRLVHGDADAPRSILLCLPRGEARQLGDLLGPHVLVSAERGRRARKRWYAGVSLLPPAPAPAAEPAPADLRWSVARAGGPGGQHVNTTASAVRVLHLPTGIHVRADAERSQTRNRALALRRLREHLARQVDGARRDRERDAWRRHHRLQRGNPVRRWRRARTGLVAAG